MVSFDRIGMIFLAPYNHIQKLSLLNGCRLLAAQLVKYRVNLGPRSDVHSIEESVSVSPLNPKYCAKWQENPKSETNSQY